ncbi:MAG: DNA repair ATPase [Flavobacteriaceae bacterium]|nr:DNA repair ATPase [Flavobacteriaceae bacterium]
MGEKQQHIPDTQLESGTYELIQGRLQKHKADLQKRLQQLNQSRAAVFGSVETKLIANNRINTENSCIAQDIVTIGDYCIFGYNVHFGLRTSIQLSDVFGVYTYDGDHFVVQSLQMLEDSVFISDFTNLYKYYRNTIFAKFAIMGNYLHMVFQLSENPTDIKTFKWLIKDDTLVYIDNRSEQEYRFPSQYDFRWKEVTRDMHRYGTHPHIAIADKVFVETVGGDLTIKIEDNTEDGKGVYSEQVEYTDQTLDDGAYRFADLGNLILMEIKPYQEKARYFAYNHKIQEVKKIPSLSNAAVLLPDDQGVVFPNGYYLQSGAYKQFDHGIIDLKFQEKIVSPNGEDFFYVFFNSNKGLYVLMAYNVIEQEVKTPIICNGFTLLDDGSFCYFKTEDEQTRHHVIQIWQTPFSKNTIVSEAHKESLLFKIGNKDIVKAMAESQALITLLNKQDNYDGLYDDISRQSLDILDSYYWIREAETQDLSVPLQAINDAANAAIDEFEKVVQLRKIAAKSTRDIQKKSDALFGKIKSTSFRSIDDFVQALSQLRSLRGELIGLAEVRYVSKTFIKELEEEIVAHTETISHRCVQFLLDKKALQPYHERVAEKEALVAGIKKVVAAKALEEEVHQIVEDLEMLIDIVSNLDIEDSSHATTIIDNISLIFATINQLKAKLKNIIKDLGASEAEAEFAAQIKLIDQSIINYLDIADTPEKTEELRNKIAIQLEELEGKFADFEAFIEKVMEKREEVYNAFEARKNSIVEARNKKAAALESAGKRILKGVKTKALSLADATEINGYFAADLMINKLRDIVQQLFDLGDGGKAEMLETQLKTAKEEAVRQLKDKKDLFVDGQDIIRLGNHQFGVNRQQLDLTIVYKDQGLFYHLSGTDFYEPITDKVLLESKAYWDQELVSENQTIYRAAYLAYLVFKAYDRDSLRTASETDLLSIVQEFSSKRYTEGYVKGVHDVDAAKIVQVLVQKDHDLGLLRYTAATRAYAIYFWNDMESESRAQWEQRLQAAAAVEEVFAASKEYKLVLGDLSIEIGTWLEEIGQELEAEQLAAYLYAEQKSENGFHCSHEGMALLEQFEKHLKKQQSFGSFQHTMEVAKTKAAQWGIAHQWMSAYVSALKPKAVEYVLEMVVLTVFSELPFSSIAEQSFENLEGMLGAHDSLQDGVFAFHYHQFLKQLSKYTGQEVPAYEEFKAVKHQCTEAEKKALRLEEFQPRVLSSFVRNKLIDQVYLPLFGDNLAKQLGSVGDSKRTDRMGMLLLVSPPGYGKTTLMEYLASRLGLVFMKINGPAIGHEVTSVDPMAANNAAAREELKKLNLALEMGNNVMLYLDDIQHCNPEFLQKFISLADGTRKIEGVYKGVSKTYDLKSKKFCVIMAGNPYTESGEKFQIPDMLANRADIYNLGDVIGETGDLFALSLIENALTSNPVLHALSSKSFDDVYACIEIAASGSREGVDLQGNYGKQELDDYISVLEKVLRIRDRVMKVNKQYIKSAAMDDADRTEPPFKLQGSYRDMNKLVAKVVPIMNEKELEVLLQAHYTNESQTLTTAAEANLLKYKELAALLDQEEKARWETIKETFVRNNKLKGLGNKNNMGQLLAQLMQFGDNLEGIEEALRKGLKK